MLRPRHPHRFHCQDVDVPTVEDHRYGIPIWAKTPNTFCDGGCFTFESSCDGWLEISREKP